MLKTQTLRKRFFACRAGAVDARAYGAWWVLLVATAASLGCGGRPARPVVVPQGTGADAAPDRPVPRELIRPSEATASPQVRKAAAEGLEAP